MPMLGKSCPSLIPPLGKDTTSRRKKAFCLWGQSPSPSNYRVLIASQSPASGSRWALVKQRQWCGTSASKADGCVVLVMGSAGPQAPQLCLHLGRLPAGW